MKIFDKLKNIIAQIREDQEINDQERSFIERNAAYWRKYHGTSLEQKKSKYVLIDYELNPFVLVSNMSLGSIIAHEHKAAKLILLPHPLKRKMREIIASYQDCLILCKKDYWYFFKLLFCLIPALKIFSQLKTPDDILNLEMNGVKVGDKIYDTILARHSLASINKLDMVVFWAIWQTLEYANFMARVADLYTIDSAVFAHNMLVAGGVPFNILLGRNVEIFLRSGSRNLTLRKVRNINQANVHTITPERKYLDYILKNHKEEVLRATEKYMLARFENEVDGLPVSLAFTKMKKTYTSRQDFAQNFQLDVNKKNIFVMLHAFNDGPHYFEFLIFKDYGQWFLETLEIAKEMKDVNWIFKEHPGANYYQTNLNLEKIFESLNEKHIVYLGMNANFNARSIQYVADGLVTCRGTAGIEFATTGVPCVLGGDSFYSDHGFTIEPKNREEYRQALEGLKSGKRLSAEQMEMAKIFMYTYGEMIVSENYYFCPSARDFHVSHELPKTFWTDAAELLEDKHAERLNHLISQMKFFINNEKYLQYVDLDVYGYMRGAVEGAGDSVLSSR